MRNSPLLRFTSSLASALVLALGLLMLSSCASSETNQPNPVDQTLNGVNKVGNAVRNVQIIRGLF